LSVAEAAVTQTVVNGLLLGLIVLAAAVCILAPLSVLGFMFWNWQKELKQSARLRQARTTQIR